MLNKWHLSRPAALVWPGVRRRAVEAEPALTPGRGGAQRRRLDFLYGIRQRKWAWRSRNPRFAYDEKIRSMISAPVAITGRSSRR